MSLAPPPLRNGTGAAFSSLWSLGDSREGDSSAASGERWSARCPWKTKARPQRSKRRASNCLQIRLPQEEVLRSHSQFIWRKGINCIMRSVPKMKFLFICRKWGVRMRKMRAFYVFSNKHCSLSWHPEHMKGSHPALCFGWDTRCLDPVSSQQIQALQWALLMSPSSGSREPTRSKRQFSQFREAGTAEPEFTAFHCSPQRWAFHCWMWKALSSVPLGVHYGLSSLIFCVPPWPLTGVRTQVP